LEQLSCGPSALWKGVQEERPLTEGRVVPKTIADQGLHTWRQNRLDCFFRLSLKSPVWFSSGQQKLQEGKLQKGANSHQVPKRPEP
jgi:hypothetical protein